MIRHPASLASPMNLLTRCWPEAGLAGTTDTDCWVRTLAVDLCACHDEDTKGWYGSDSRPDPAHGPAGLLATKESWPPTSKGGCAMAAIEAIVFCTAAARRRDHGPRGHRNSQEEALQTLEHRTTQWPAGRIVLGRCVRSDDDRSEYGHPDDRNGSAALGRAEKLMPPTSEAGGGLRPPDAQTSQFGRAGPRGNDRCRVPIHRCGWSSVSYPRIPPHLPELPDRAGSRPHGPRGPVRRLAGPDDAAGLEANEPSQEKLGLTGSQLLVSNLPGDRRQLPGSGQSSCGPWTLAATLKVSRTADPALADPAAVADLAASLAEGLAKPRGRRAQADPWSHHHSPAG